MPEGKERDADFNSEANLISNMLISSYLHQPEILFAECVLTYKFNLKTEYITFQKCSFACLHSTGEFPRKFQKNTVGDLSHTRRQNIFQCFYSFRYF